MLTIVAGRQDYDAIARRLKDARAEAVLFAGYPAEARVILDGFRREGLDARVLGSDSLATPEFTDTAGANPERLRVLMAHNLDVAALTHGAVEAWADGVRQANTFEPKEVAGTLSRITAKTSALGPISFDENGDARVVSFAPAVWNGTSWEPRD
jgi:branched-chain amino acid transport system substrate-binding protein